MTETIRGTVHEQLAMLAERGRALAIDAKEIQAYETERVRQERRETRERRKEILDGLHVPLDDDGCARVIRADYVETPALLAVKTAMSLARPTRFLLLTGGKNAGKSVGTGKTTAAAHALVSMGGGVYIESNELATVAASRRFEDRERIRLAREAEILVVDEFGVEATIAQRTARDVALFDVVNRRQSKPKITILITNLTTNAIVKQLDERVRSRMRSSLVVVDCTGDDMRRGER